MKCVGCPGDTRVIDSRPSGKNIRRRRSCDRCGRRFSTIELALDARTGDIPLDRALRTVKKQAPTVLDAALSNMVNGAILDTALSKVAEAAPPPVFPARRYRCGACGKRGHNARACPDSKEARG